MGRSARDPGNAPGEMSRSAKKNSSPVFPTDDASPSSETMGQSLVDPSERYRAVGLAAEHAGHGIVIVQNLGDKEGLITFVNNAVAKSLGYSQDELIGMTLADVIHPDSFPSVVDRYRRRQEGEVLSRAYEIRLLRRDGSTAVVEASGVGVDVDHRMVTVVFLTDVTQRRLTEDMLHESEEKYRQLVENTGAVLYSVDENGVTTYISPVFESLFGRSPAELVGKRFADFIHPEDLPSSMENFRKVMSGSLQEPWECRMVLPGGGGIFWVQGHNRPVYRAEAIVGFQGVLVDVTARKQVDALKDQFISLVSHELRTPLTVIMGAVNTALSEGPRLSTQETRRLLQDAASEADLLSHILENLLELSRSRADRLNLQLEIVVLKELVRKITYKVRPLSPAHQLVMDLPRTLPPIRADRIRLERILYNLLDNAVKYSPGGEIRVSARREGRELVVSVHDQGPGMPPEHQAKLFRPFERVGSAQTDGIQGIGLGLLVCRSLVEAHGGRIWFKSETGQGTTFYFALPIKPT